MCVVILITAFISMSVINLRTESMLDLMFNDPDDELNSQQTNQ